MLLMIYKVFGMIVSPKCFDNDTGEIPIVDEVTGAGYQISAGGISCGDSVVEALMVLLTKVIRSLKQLQSLIGSLLQAHVAFKFNLEQISTFGELMAVLQAVLKRSKKGESFKYAEDIKPTCEKLKEFVQNLTLAKCNPADLIDADHCLIYLGDIGDTGKGMLVYKVAIADARDVMVPEDLEDPNISVLVRCFHGVLSSSELDWLTVENETNNMVTSLKKTAGMLVAACMGYPVDGPQKVGVYSDSSAAVQGMSNLFVPDGQVEFLTAKARKVAHWRDDVAWTQHLPIWFAGIPGHENSLSDFLSHMHDELLARARKQKEEKKGSVREFVMSAAVRVCKGCDADEGDGTVSSPIGFDASKMLLSDDEWRTLCSKYVESQSEIFEVKISTIYRVLVLKDESVSKLEAKRVRGWKHKIFVVQVGDGDTALFVKAPQQDMEAIDWDRQEDDGSAFEMVQSSLVVLIPEGVMVRVTSVELEAEEEDASSYRFRDLRNDLLVMAHEFQLHAKVGLMYMFVAQRAWWPELKEMIKRHIKWCGLCAAKIKASRLAGHGMVSMCSYRHVTSVHVVLPEWLQKQIGMAAVQVISDRASGKIAAVLQEKINADETGLAPFLGWIQHNGLMRTFTTDQGSPYTAEVFEWIRKTYGVKVHNVTAVGDSIGLGDGENENRWIQKVISEAGAKGDVVTANQFRVYLAPAVIERDQIMETAGSTVFERIHGFKALSVGDIMMDVDGVVDEKIVTLEKYKNSIAPFMAERSRELIASYQAQCNERHYLASLARDIEAQFKVKQDTVFVKGDKVTWINSKKNAETGTVVAVRFEGGIPMSATVDIGGQRKKIQYNNLKEQAAKRPQLMLGLTVRLEAGMMAFWRDDEGDLVGSRVIDRIDEDRMLVQYYAEQENGSIRVWLPLWQVDEGSDCLRRKDCPTGYEAAVDEVSVDMAEVSGEIKESFYIDENTLLKLEAWMQM